MPEIIRLLRTRFDCHLATLNIAQHEGSRNTRFAKQIACTICPANRSAGVTIRYSSFFQEMQRSFASHPRPVPDGSSDDDSKRIRDRLRGTYGIHTACPVS